MLGRLRPSELLITVKHVQYLYNMRESQLTCLRQFSPDHDGGQCNTKTTGLPTHYQYHLT